MLDQKDSNVSLISTFSFNVIQQQIKDYLDTEVYSNLYCNFISDESSLTTVL